LEVFGRKDNMMISGGENIHPEEIERVLLEHPDVERVMVVAKPDPEYGERPVAFVKSVNGYEFESWLRERMPAFKVPKDWRPWSSEWDAYSKPPRGVARMIVRSQN
jgi:O-succinylbenzoic acid--CoA ligase